jgi:hypothetical protein
MNSNYMNAYEFIVACCASNQEREDAKNPKPGHNVSRSMRLIEELMWKNSMGRTSIVAYVDAYLHPDRSSGSHVA